MACMYRVKFIEVSVGINHNVDELLAGTLSQIRVKREQCELQVLKKIIILITEKKLQFSPFYSSDVVFFSFSPYNFDDDDDDNNYNNN